MVYSRLPLHFKRWLRYVGTERHRWISRYIANEIWWSYSKLSSLQWNCTAGKFLEFSTIFLSNSSKCSLSAVALFKRWMWNFTGQTMLQELRVKEEEMPSMQSRLGRSLMRAKQSKNTSRIPVFSVHLGGKKETILRFYTISNHPNQIIHPINK